MVRVLVAAFVMVTGVAGAVTRVDLAADGDPASDFRIDVTPASQQLVPGQRARFSVDVIRTGGAPEPVRLRVAGQPDGVSADLRLAGGAVSGTVPAWSGGATLSIDTAAGTEPGTTFRVRLVAESGGVHRSRVLTLRLIRARDGLFRLFTRPGRQLSVPGTTVSIDVYVKRRVGFRRRVRLSAGDLPPGWTARFAREQVRDRTRLRVSPPANAHRGDVRVVVSGSVRLRARTIRRHQVAVVEVGEPRRFRISGDAATPLAPGLSVPLDLELDNPHRFAIRLTDLSVSLVDSTSEPACSGSENYTVEQYSGPHPLRLAPGKQRLSDLVGSARLWPQVGMRELPVSQDECKGAQLSLRYRGTAVR